MIAVRPVMKEHVMPFNSFLRPPWGLGTLPKKGIRGGGGDGEVWV